mgnify:CR=1
MLPIPLPVPAALTEEPQDRSDIDGALLDALAHFLYSYAPDTGGRQDIHTRAQQIFQIVGEFRKTEAYRPVKLNYDIDVTVLPSSAFSQVRNCV